MTSLPAAPLDHPVRLTTRSGLAIDVRPAGPEDEARLRALFQAVSAEDRRFRFLSACDDLAPAQLQTLTDVDHWRTESFLAFTEDGTLAATGMLACDKAMKVAEVAISIRSDHKGRGIGWTLLEFLAQEAQRRGVEKLLSIESRENHSAIELEREMGFVAREVEGDSTVVLLEARF